MVQSLVSGLLSGGGYALIGVCIVIMYRTVRVVNFAQAAIGAFGAYVAVQVYEQGWAYVPALILGGLAGAAIAGICGLIMGRFFAESSTEARSTVAIAMLVALLTIGFRVFGRDPRNFPEILTGSKVHVAGVSVGGSTLVTVGGAILLAFVISQFLDRTEAGIRLRALSERPQAAELLGVPAQWLAVGAWTFAGFFSTVGLLLIAPTRQSDFFSLGLIVLPAIAAASLGLFQNLWLAVAGGLLIGMLEGMTHYWQSVAAYSDAVPLVVIAAVLVWSQRAEVWDAAR
jgi:branched-chain amino acid transport system permease protein